MTTYVEFLCVLKLLIRLNRFHILAHEYKYVQPPIIENAIYFEKKTMWVPLRDRFSESPNNLTTCCAPNLKISWTEAPEENQNDRFDQINISISYRGKYDFAKEFWFIRSSNNTRCMFASCHLSENSQSESANKRKIRLRTSNSIVIWRCGFRCRLRRHCFFSFVDLKKEPSLN